MAPKNKYENALGDVYDKLVWLEKSTAEKLTKEEMIELSRCIERCKYWKQPEFDDRFARGFESND